MPTGSKVPLTLPLPGLCPLIPPSPPLLRAARCGASPAVRRAIAGRGLVAAV